ncbi:hypothetical protein M413DRAFT_444395 [Hebeloma cylindrosporum]|uniref:Uncharacterized protein n=1 Tax=Hebeloma cylindrosporum TaxID=76867 RepID=A0A0C3CEV1_HEBCY|nr:hypothetical protein M413DRAFT_444395 [Hebeloma cylindrosporum h7]
MSNVQPSRPTWRMRRLSDLTVPLRNACSITLNSISVTCCFAVGLLTTESTRNLVSSAYLTKAVDRYLCPTKAAAVGLRPA